MKLLKRATVIAAVSVVAFAMNVAPVLASTSINFYDIYINGQTATNAYFTAHSSVLSIKGWQITNDVNHPPSEQYSLYQYGLWSDTLYGSTRIPGAYTQSGTWYYYQFTNISANYQYYLAWHDYSGAVAINGQGNVYDGP